ncbi:MAG: DNA repair protein RecO [Oscillospiraceae bacterium]|jgi:DNA repair protein RecO (recombination protein O)
MKSACDGLVIWETKTGEADRVIEILTARGLVTAYAKGSLRPKNRLASSTALLAYSGFELYKGSNMYTVDDAESIERFMRLSTDMKAYSLVLYFCELLKTLLPGEEDTAEQLSLMLNSMFLTDKGKTNLEQIKSVFELKIMQLSGYMPDLVECSRCGKNDSPDGLYFDITGGTWLCSDCASSAGLELNCSEAVLKAMRFILDSDVKKAFGFKLGEANLRNLSGLTSRYVEAQIDFRPKTLEFYNSL